MATKKKAAPKKPSRKKGTKKRRAPKQKPSDAWIPYEQLSRHILQMFAKDFGVVFFEGKQKVRGNSGTKWEIDAKGVRESDGSIIVVECRRHTTAKQSQEKIAALAWRIADVGASGGVIVSPFDVQNGPKLVAAAGNVVRVRLDPTSTMDSFQAEFIDKLKVVAGVSMFMVGGPPSSNKKT